MTISINQQEEMTLDESITFIAFISILSRQLGDTRIYDIEYQPI